MFLRCGGEIIDPDLELLEDVLSALDRHLGAVLDEWRASPEKADALDHLDRAEHIAGLGFVACQAYVTATYGFVGIAKATALQLGPSHASGQPVVQIVNHAANFWKHHPEWRFDKGPARRARIESAFDSVGFPVGTDYPLSGILTALVQPQFASLSPLVAMLKDWREVFCTFASEQHDER